MQIDKKTIFNWSRTKSFHGEVLKPNNYNEIKNFIKNNSKKNSISVMGGGCSYGDCYLNNEGKIIDIRNLDKILEINYEERFVKAQTGVLIEDLLNELLKKGYYLNSIPGANNATLGGCINSNVHGKDAFKVGVFSNNVISLKVINSSGIILDLHQGDENFFYALGTYGLNYIILEVKLRIRKINSCNLEVITKKFNNYDEMINLFNKFESNNYDMMGTWIDHFSNNGRGIFKAAKWSKDNQLDRFKKINLKIGYFKKIYIKFFYPLIKVLFVNRLIIKIANKLLFTISKDKVEKVQYSDFYFPQQKYLPEEAKLFKEGKINIQILIPFKNVRNHLQLISKICKNYKMESWWLGIKKHKLNHFLFNFAIDGFDVTLQWSKHYISNNNFDKFYNELLEVLIENKCLIYLTQDVLLDKKNFYEIYKNQNTFIENKKKIDPDFIFKNDLFNRLF